MHKTVSPLRGNKWNLESGGGWESAGSWQLAPGETEPGKDARYAGGGV